jgi:cation:H+ antiporter
MLLPLFVLIASFIFLFLCAHYVIDGAVKLAHITRIPKFIVGIIVVGFATTAPELAVSVMAAFIRHSEIALGNAVGSVICDDSLALGLAAVVAPAAIVVNPLLLRETALFLIGIDLLAYALILNGRVGRAEGVLLLLILLSYYLYTLAKEKKRRAESSLESRPRGETVARAIGVFLIGIIGVIVASRGVVWSAIGIAKVFGISTTIIGLTIIAIGTSLPEISTCLVAARRGEGEIAVGDIIGADILNILWIIGLSALVNPIVVGKRFINFAFPWMIGIVALTLLFLRIRYRMGKVKGAVLLMLYALYIIWTIIKFY